jgi:hypothetical protein
MVHGPLEMVSLLKLKKENLTTIYCTVVHQYGSFEPILNFCLNSLDNTFKIG